MKEARSKKEKGQQDRAFVETFISIAPSAQDKKAANVARQVSHLEKIFELSISI